VLVSVPPCFLKISFFTCEVKYIIQIFYRAQIYLKYRKGQKITRFCGAFGILRVKTPGKTGQPGGTSG
jgi:hypothetical protein